MADSLRANGLKFKLWVLCLTEECKIILDTLDVPEIKSYSLQTLEKEHPELQSAKNNRTTPEYYFTISPFWPNWLLKTHSEIPSLTYLDSDLEFLNSPSCLFDEVKDSVIGIIEHRFHPSFDISQHSGRFNVGWIYFRRSQTSFNCLEQWQNQCLAWCKDRFEDGKFADQKYLDSWPEDFEGIHIFENPGANLAPWNLNTHKIKYQNGLLFSDNQRVVFYHFQMIRALDPNHFLTAFEIYRVPIELRKKIIDWLYVPHIVKLLKKEADLAQKGFNAKAFNSTRNYSRVDSQRISDSSLKKLVDDGEVIKIY